LGEHNILHRIVEPVTVVGRAKDCHLEIPEDYDNVERYHATIFYKEGIFAIADGCEERPTRFGTFVNGIQVEPQTKVPLRSDDRIVLGGFRRKEAHELARGACEVVFERRS
jgi:predicted component of type VI protein secretion system